MAAAPAVFSSATVLATLRASPNPVSASTIKGRLVRAVISRVALATSVRVVTPKSGRANWLENPAPEKYRARNPDFSATFATAGLGTPGATTARFLARSFRSLAAPFSGICGRGAFSCFMSVPSNLPPFATIKSGKNNLHGMLSSYATPAPYPAVFVHGAGGNNLLWKRTLERLSGGSKASAVNLPGHPSGEITCKSIPEYSQSVLDFMREGKLNAPVVAGHSMGSAVALT